MIQGQSVLPTITHFQMVDWPNEGNYYWKHSFQNGYHRSNPDILIHNSNTTNSLSNSVTPTSTVPFSLGGLHQTTTDHKG